MTGLLIGVFVFLGIHTRLWLVPLGLPRIVHDSKKFREGEIASAERRRMVHALRAVRAVPAFPGRDQLPAAGHHRHAAEVLLHRLGQGDLRIIGGPETARTLHRFGAIVTFLYFGLHLTSLRRQVLEGPRASFAIRQTGKFQLQAVCGTCCSAPTR